MEIKQQLRLSQQLVMTPQLQQAIRLLQLSRLELIDEIRKELDANPVLSDDEGERPPPQANGDGAPPLVENGALLSDERLGLSERLSERSRADELQRAKDEKTVQDIDWEKFLENRTLQQPLQASRGGFDELPPSSKTSPSSRASSIT